MKIARRRYVSAAALALVVSLFISPLTLGRSDRDGGDSGIDFQSRLVQIVRKIQRVFGITTQDVPTIPKP